MHGKSVAFKQKTRNLLHTEKAFIPYDQIQIFNHRILAINQTQFMAFLEGFCIVGKEQRVGSITVTIHLDSLPENCTLHDGINVFNGRKVIRDDVRVHIVDVHHCHAMFGVVRQDPDLRYDWTREKSEVFVTMLEDGTPLSSVESMKNSNLLNTASSNSLP